MKIQRPSLTPRFALVAAAVGYGGVFLWIQGCSEKPEAEGGGGTSAGTPGNEGTVPTAFTPPVRNPAEGYEFVGAAACAGCHAQEFADWQQSHHHKAMQPATPETVLGDFDDVTFTHFGRETRFFRKGDEFWADVETAEGERKDLRIEYTFGFDPLQQYLVAFPGGRYQALQVCWDSRPEEEGGQRWFHLYPDEEIPPSDPLHWSKLLFNWNYMCADCHSTDLRKNFDVESNAYDTKWAEMNVSCEACHGPGSRHVDWAREYAAAGGGGPDQAKAAAGEDLGLLVRLKEPGETAAWVQDPETGQPVRSRPLESTVQVETCAPCHAHRRPIQTAMFPGQSFLDTHVPSVLEEPLYHADGQIEEEVYVFGSFVQSRMFHHDVRCTDCHHPHTSRTYFDDNRLCARCHDAARYDTTAHHHHQTGSTGASCVACHMPGKFYMVIDWRLDHSIRVPRPDLSETLGTPNACNQCHADKETKWAADAATEWWGESLTGRPHFAEAIAAGRRRPTTAAPTLRKLVADAAVPGIARATAVGLLGAQPDPANLPTIEKALADTNPQVRQQAVRSLEGFPMEDRLKVGEAALFDAVRAVRIEAARLLAGADRNRLDGETRKALESGIEEFIEAQSAVADHPGGHMGLALLHTETGDLEKAEAAYRKAVEVGPDHLPPKINLAELYYQTGRNSLGGPLLEDAVRIAPSDSLAQEALGRWFIREKRYDEGLERLRLAADLDPERPEIQFFHGVALNSLGRFDEALPYLERAHQLDPLNPEYLVGLATVCRDNQAFDLAAQYAGKLVQLDPANPSFQQLYQQLEGIRRQIEAIQNR